MANSTGEMPMAEHEDRVAEFLGQLPDRVRAHVSTLQGLQAEHDALESQFHEEVAALERKYELLYTPFYKERAKIVSGKDDKSAGGDVASTETSAAAAAAAPSGGGGGSLSSHGIPNFWLTAMSNYRDIKMHMTDRDAEALKYLEDIRWTRLDGDNPQSFKLEFLFAPNPFFTNAVLTKTYFMEEEDDDSVLARAAGTAINWKAGKNLCASTEPIKRGGMKSFFAFFSPPDIPDDENSLDEEEAMELRDELEEHCELGIAIKEQLIPRAVSWYTGEAVDEDDEEDEDDDEEDDDDADDH